jgi:hypothetical protein
MTIDADTTRPWMDAARQPGGRNGEAAGQLVDVVRII